MQAIHLHHQASLLEGARQFLAEVLRLEAEVCASSAPGPGGKAAPVKGALDVGRTLREQLNQQALRRTRRVGEEDPQAEKVRYALASFADEVFLHVPWHGKGKEEWSTRLLEGELFHTQNAGTRLFDDIQEMLDQRSAAQAELAAVYLLVLSLGFQGRYRGMTRQVELEDWRVRVAAFLSSLMEEGLDVQGAQRQLFPNAYVTTVDMMDTSSGARRLASLRPWLLVLAAGLVAYLTVGEAIWYFSTRPLRADLERIQREATR